MIPYGKQTLDDNDITAVIETLESDYLTQGPKVPVFEQAISSYVQAKYAIATSSATAALHLGCLALGLSKKDIGWTVPLTFAASANAIRYCQAKIGFVDINLDTGCICPQALAQKLTQAQRQNKLPKILIVVHYAGISCDMEAIAALCAPFNIKIIEDAAHAIGGQYQNKPIGSCQYSDMTIFSFHPVKVITSGEGGMITTNNQSLANELALLRSHGITKDEGTLNDKEVGDWYYEQQSLGFNYRMSDIHAALGVSQLSKLEQFVEVRNQQALRYKESLANLPLTLLEPLENSLCSWHIFVIRLTPDAKITRLALYNALKAKGVGCQVHYIPVHTHPYYQELGFKWGDYPHAEEFYHHCLTIPLFPLLGAQQDFIIKELKALLQ